VFGLDTDHRSAPRSARPTSACPIIDPAYVFDADTTLAILAGFALQSPRDGPGLSRHRQVDAYRAGRGAPQLAVHPHQSRCAYQPYRPDRPRRDRAASDGQQVTEFREGLLPWALQTPTALVFDEYDAGRPDVMFVIQRVLETEGKLTLLDQNRVIRPNPYFRLFATANTVVSATPAACITAPSRSTRARWTAGTSW
jgi:cobaltochelatase CobS